MVRYSLLLLLLALSLQAKIADSYILFDAQNGRIIDYENILEKRSPASLTKLLTAYTAIQREDDLDRVITVAGDYSKLENSKIGILRGEKYTIRDLLKMTLIKSANDAAFELAYQTSNGNILEFVEDMNKNAKKIGMTRSHFTNPAGLDFGDNYSTASDLALLAVKCSKIKVISDITSMKEFYIRELTTGRILYGKTTNKLMFMDPEVKGFKTGYTQKAGRCLIARKKSIFGDKILVMLGASKNRWNDAYTLLNKY